MNFATLIAAFSIWDEAQRAVGLTQGGWWYLAAMLGTCFFAMIAANAYVYGPVFDTLSALGYVRLVLGAKLTYREAAEVAWMFLPNDRGVWYPMKELKKLPAADRGPAVLRMNEKLRTGP